MEHRFWYEFQPEKYVLTCNNICFDCAYELVIQITNDTGKVIFNDTVDIEPIGGYDLSCGADSILKLWTGDSLDNSGFSLDLPLGKYHIYKKIALKKESSETYWKAYLDSDSACFIPFDSFMVKAYSNIYDCDSQLYPIEPDSFPKAKTYLYETMLKDVSPGNQYGAYELNGVYFAMKDGGNGVVDQSQFENEF